MSTPFISMVDHKTIYRNFGLNKLYDEDGNEIRDLTDDDKDLVFHEKSPTDDFNNTKKFIVEEPTLINQIGEYLLKLLLNEMNWETFHNIQYKQVSNKEFKKRLKRYRTKKFRFYFENKWITYYFNQISKSRVVEEDAICNVVIHSTYPPRGIIKANYLEEPCIVKFSPPFGKNPCEMDQFWAVSIAAGLEDDFESCYSPIDGVLKNEDYFYTKPGENDYIIEAITIDYDRSSHENLKPTEYYILDRDGYYFTKGKHNYEEIQKKVLENFNNDKTHNMSISTSKRIISITRTFDEFEVWSGHMVREFIGRFNLFKKQYNQYISMFNDKTNKDGWFCPYKEYNQTFAQFDEGLNVIDTSFDIDGTNLYKDGELMQKKYDVILYDLSIKEVLDIKILDWLMDYGHCDIYNNRYNECIAINTDTVEDFLNYAIINKYAWSVDAY